jgi:hypothetical protein
MWGVILVKPLGLKNVREYIGPLVVLCQGALDASKERMSIV